MMSSRVLEGSACNWAVFPTNMIYAKSHRRASVIDWEKVWYPALLEGMLPVFKMMWPLVVLAIAGGIVVSMAERLAKRRRSSRRRW